MTPAPQSPSRQGALILAKINAATRKAAAQDQGLELTKTALGDAFAAYFTERAESAELSKRPATSIQLAAMAVVAGSWFHFDYQDETILIAISDDLVLAAADFAICQKISPSEGAKPTAVDRSIAAALARRLIVAAFGHAETERKFQPDLRGISDNAQRLSLPSAPHGWALLQFSGSIGSDGQAFTVMIGRLKTALEDVLAPAIVAEPAISHRKRAISVSARCIVGAIEAPLRRALDLKRGDVLRLDWRGPHGLPLVAGGKTIAIGSLGEHNGRRAMKIADFSGSADIAGT